VFLGKVGSDLQKPDGLVVITEDNLPHVLLGLELQEIFAVVFDEYEKAIFLPCWFLLL
jgi:hypothetical protein